MHQNIKYGILTRLKNLNMSIAKLEREAGLKVNVARNIIAGYSKKPSAETIYAIAKTLQCSVDDLLSNKDENTKNIKIKNLSLYQEIGQNVLEFMKNEGSCLNMIEYNKLIQEIYLFSLQFNLNEPDKNFTHWILRKNIVEKSIA